jgi:hypothetical protein
MVHLYLILSYSMSLRLGQPVLKIFPKSKAEELGVFLVSIIELICMLQLNLQDIIESIILYVDRLHLQELQNVGVRELLSCGALLREQFAARRKCAHDPSVRPAHRALHVQLDSAR